MQKGRDNREIATEIASLDNEDQKPPALTYFHSETKSRKRQALPIEKYE